MLEGWPKKRGKWGLKRPILRLGDVTFQVTVAFLNEGVKKLRAKEEAGRVEIDLYRGIADRVAPRRECLI